MIEIKARKGLLSRYLKIYPEGVEPGEITIVVEVESLGSESAVVSRAELIKKIWPEGVDAVLKSLDILEQVRDRIPGRERAIEKCRDARDILEGK